MPETSGKRQLGKHIEFGLDRLKSNEHDSIVREGRLYILKKEDQIENLKLLRAIGRKSARNALRENKELGSPVTYINRDSVIKELPDGEKVILKKLPHSRTSEFSKGDVIRIEKG